MVDMARRDSSLSLSLGGASILHRIKEAYLIWIAIVPHIPKTARFTIGARIENKLLDLLECSYIAYFSGQREKLEKIDECIRTLDIIKFLIMTAWQGKLISNKQYEDIGIKLNEIGKMLGGWKRNVINPKKTPRK